MMMGEQTAVELIVCSWQFPATEKMLHLKRTHQSSDDTVTVRP